MKPFTLGYVFGRSVRSDPARGLRLICSGKQPAREPVLPPFELDTTTLLPNDEPFRSLARAVVTGDVAAAEKLAADAVKRGIDPLEIALKGLLTGMDAISHLYANRQTFVPEVLLAARVLRAGLDASGGTRESIGRKGVVLLHTADGDLHDIGKNIVGAIVEANGYRVIDLGTSVDTSRVLTAIREYAPVAVLGSSLMTSTRDGFLATADAIRKNGITVPFIIGGGACNTTFASQRENIRYARNPSDVIAILDGSVSADC